MPWPLVKRLPTLYEPAKFPNSATSVFDDRSSNQAFLVAREWSEPWLYLKEKRRRPSAACVVRQMLSRPRPTSRTRIPANCAVRTTST
ncbi:conserved hypothetical protein [Rhizobium sp. EC-SD404]|nr:conserved hypothetical protein [Rhizobium sp. EC-SD404]